MIERPSLFTSLLLESHTPILGSQGFTEKDRHKTLKQNNPKLAE